MHSPPMLRHSSVVGGGVGSEVVGAQEVVTGLLQKTQRNSVGKEFFFVLFILIF